MATTKQQEQGFKKSMAEALPLSFLGSMLDWIRDNLNPDEVFDNAQLKKLVGNTCLPDEVFSEEDLKRWAIENGFTQAVKKEMILSYANSAEIFDKQIFK